MKNNCHNLKTITSLKKEQKELLIFLGIAFGLTFLMGLLWGVSRHYGKEGVSNVTQIVYPTLGVVLAKLIYEKDDPLLPKRTFIGLIVFAIPLIVLNILAFFCLRILLLH